MDSAKGVQATPTAVQASVITHVESGLLFAEASTMLAVAHSATLIGLDAFPVRVEVDASRGVPSFELVGLAETAVRESRVRVKSALAQIGVDMTECRVVVNLAPADLKKNGSGFDLAIAAAVLGALGKVSAESLASTVFLGELSLAGGVHGLRGALPHVLGAKQRGFPRIVVPRASEAEASLVPGIEALSCGTLRELLEHLLGGASLPRVRPGADREPPEYDDLADVRGQRAARRALEICAAGGHNLLMIGPPGAGKTMLARRLPGIMPPLTSAEAIEVMTLQSVSGLLRRGPWLARPFRAPHHTLSEVALVGGSDPPRPGEVSLAHHGVLFLDELAEFRRPALEALRQPLEDGVVTVSRAHTKATFFARPLVVGAMNPCPCGFLGDTSRCGCTADRVRAYRGRLSGPLIDRLDVHVVLPPVDVASLVSRVRGEASSAVRERVITARGIQAARARRGARHHVNAALSSADLERVGIPDAEGLSLLERAVGQHMLSARAYGKVLRVARTIADLDGSAEVRSPHVGEAISLRAFDRGGSCVRAA